MYWLVNVLFLLQGAHGSLGPWLATLNGHILRPSWLWLASVWVETLCVNTWVRIGWIRSECCVVSASVKGIVLSGGLFSLTEMYWFAHCIIGCSPHAHINTSWTILMLTRQDVWCWDRPVSAWALWQVFNLIQILCVWMDYWTFLY